jgi:O-antigen ligase
VCALVALLGFAALGLGGKPAGVRAVVVCAVLALVLAEWLPRAWRGERPTGFERAWFPLWLAASALIALQLAPLPRALLEHLGAVPAGLREATDVGARRISAMPAASASYWASFSAYWALCLIAARLHRRELRALALAAAVLAALQASYGIVALLVQSETVLGLWPRGAHRHYATGSFANRNHFASLLALLWPLGLAVFASPAWSSRTARGWARPVLALLYSLLLVSALCASRSRAGLLAALLGVALWLASVRSRTFAPTRAAPLLPAWIAPGLGLLLACALGAEPPLDRFAALPEHGDRLRVWRAALELPASVWWLGAGAGSFADVFKLVHPGELLGSYPQAHSDYLELGVDFGLLGAAALAACAVLWWRRVGPRAPSGLAAGALAGVLAVAAHAWVDFALQLPGVAVPFWTLLGIAVNPNACASVDAPRGGALEKRT